MPMRAVVESPRAKMRALIAGCLRRELVRVVRATAGGGGTGVFMERLSRGSIMINHHPHHARVRGLRDRHRLLCGRHLFPNMTHLALSDSLQAQVQHQNHLVGC